MPVPPLLFDLDGTLVDSLPDIAASVDFVRGQHDLPALGCDGVRALVGDGLTRLLARALPHLDAPARARAETAYRAHHFEQCTRLVRPFPGARAHLERWRDAGWPLAVVTNKPIVFATRVLEACDLDSFFPVVIGGDSTLAKKPDPAPCLAALAALGTPPGTGTMIGDGVQDLRAGRAAGLRTIGVLFGYRAQAELRAERADGYWTGFGIAAGEAVA
jgi:phosphoglycolate phosphatase